MMITETTAMWLQQNRDLRTHSDNRQTILPLQTKMKLGNVQVKALLILGWEIENQECYSDKILNDAYEFDFDLHVNCTIFKKGTQLASYDTGMFGCPGYGIICLLWFLGLLYCTIMPTFHSISISNKSQWHVISQTTSETQNNAKYATKIFFPEICESHATCECLEWEWC